MEHMENATQRAAEVMSQGAMPCTSAMAMLPTSSQNIAEAGARVLHHSGPQSSVILSAMLAILILATTVAFLLFQVLEKQAAARRQAGAGMQGLRSCDTLHERLLSNIHEPVFLSACSICPDPQDIPTSSDGRE